MAGCSWWQKEKGKIGFLSGGTLLCWKQSSRPCPTESANKQMWSCLIFKSNCVGKPLWRSSWTIWKTALWTESLSHCSSEHSYKYLHLRTGREAAGISTLMARACWEGAGGRAAPSGNFVLTWKHWQGCAPVSGTARPLWGSPAWECPWAVPRPAAQVLTNCHSCVSVSSLGEQVLFLGCYSVLELLQNKTEPLAPPLLSGSEQNWVSPFRQLLGSAVWF